MKRQFLTIASSRLLGAAIQALVGIGLARSSGPHVYGEITAFMGSVVFLFVVFGCGASSYLGRARALQNHDDVATALRLNVAGSLMGLAAVALPVLLGIMPLTSGPILVLLVAGMALDKNTDALLSVMIADGERVAPAVNVVLRRLLTAVLFFGWLSTGGEPVTAYCVASAIGPAAGQIHASTALRTHRIERATPTPMRDVIRRALPFGINDIAVQSKSLDVVTVAAVTSPFTAGLYAAAAKLIAPAELVASALAGVLLPRASLMTGPQQRTVALKLTLGAAAIYPLIAIVTQFAEPLIVVILGETFIDAAAAFAILLFSLPLLLLSSPVSALLQGMHRERLVAVNSMIFAVLLPIGIAFGAFVGNSTGAAMAVVIVTAAKALSLVLPVFILAGRVDF